MEKQLELDLNDKFQKFEAIAKKMVIKNNHYGGSTTMVFKRFNYKTSEPEYWLGTRHFYYDVDYVYSHEIDWDVAKYLVLELGIPDFMNCVREDFSKEKTVTCKVCGCVKTIEELKQDHKSCFQE